MRADLHVHSHFSDGHYSPDELVMMAKKAGLCAMALTDHDTVEGNRSLIEAGLKHAFEVVPGVEISTSRGDMVGLFVDSENSWLQRIISVQQQRNTYRVKKSIELLNRDGVAVSYDDLCEMFPFPVVDVQHLAEFLFKRGFSGDFWRLYAENFKPGAKYHVAIDEPTPEEAIRAIRAAGGAAIFAHPWLNDYEYLFRHLDLLVHLGLCGVEDETSLWRPGNYMTVRDRVRAACRKTGIALSKGSDFHFKGIGAPIGAVSCDYSVVREIKRRLGI